MTRIGRGGLTDWAAGLWDIYHRHPWVLQAAAAGPPADPGQLAWLDAGLAALGDTGLAERDKLAAVMAVLHFVRGAAALTSRPATSRARLPRSCSDGSWTPTGSRRLAAAVEAGVFDDADNDHLADFDPGLAATCSTASPRDRRARLSC